MKGIVGGAEFVSLIPIECTNHSLFLPPFPNSTSPPPTEIVILWSSFQPNNIRGMQFLSRQLRTHNKESSSKSIAFFIMAAQHLTINSKLTLNSGYDIPILGYGVCYFIFLSSMPLTIYCYCWSQWATSRPCNLGVIVRYFSCPIRFLLSLLSLSSYFPPSLFFKVGCRKIEHLWS